MDINDKGGLSALQVVARALAEHSTLTCEQIERALSAALNQLMVSAEAEIRADRDDSDYAVNLARQYQAVSECILFLGSQLIAFEDMEADDDPDDPTDPKN